MTFTSIDFAVFLPIVFLLYWYATFGSIKLQNALIVVASYLFYGWWDWRFLSLLLFSTVLDYSIGRGLSIQNNLTKRKILLWTSMLLNLGLLGFFKYYNFFVDNFVDAFSLLGMKINVNTLNIILPVGISFYTFQTMSYTIDVYKKKLEPTKDFLSFAAFVSFFPQLVAGPIERARNLLPQFHTKRTFNYIKAVDGMRQILWGLFKKIVIADNCAEYANQIFNNSAEYSGSTLIIGGIFFTIQIYADFSGYSDIAIGTARLFGVNLSKNFNFPFFAQSIPELWQKWHMTLTSWLYEAVFTPLSLAFRDYGKWGLILAFYIHLILIGFWHGANWTFIIFGFIHGCIFVPYILFGTVGKKKKKAKGFAFPLPMEFVNIIITFTIFMFTCIVFRSENIGHAWEFFSEIFSSSLFTIPHYDGARASVVPILLAMVLFIAEWIGREDEFAIAKIGLTWRRPVRIAMYYVIVGCIFWFAGKEQEFIYFQF